MDLRITVVSGAGTGTSHIFSEFPISIGRYPENDIVITDDIVSRRHAAIANENGQLMVIDLKSTNGTFVNKDKVDGQRLLDGSELIFIGYTGLKISILS